MIARRRLAAAGALGLLLPMLGIGLFALGGGDDGAAGAARTARKPARPRVALQVGHWQHDTMPRELRWVGRSAGGAAAGGVVEWQVNLAIARRTQRLLQREGLAVDLVPATVQPGYRAAAFVSLHADGNGDPSVAGFKISPPERDGSGLARALNDTLARRYAEQTGLSWNPSITADMTGYYAFDSSRFRHSISPATPAVVLETGFLTSAEDRRVIIAAPQRAAAGIAGGILDFLRRRQSAG